MYIDGRAQVPQLSLHFHSRRAQHGLGILGSAAVSQPATKAEPFPLDGFPAPSTGGGEHCTGQHTAREKGNVGLKDSKSKTHMEHD